MSRSFSRRSAEEEPEDWVSMWETDAGFWEDASANGNLSGIQGSMESLSAHDRGARKPSSGKSRRPGRKDRSGWGSYPG